MSDVVTELAERAMSLPVEQRARLAEQILSTLDPQDDSVEQAWDQEIRKRLDEIDSGLVTAIPANEAFAKVRKALRR